MIVTSHLYEYGVNKIDYSREFVMNDALENITTGRVTFLNSLSQTLPQNPSTNILRSYYLTKCKGLTLKSTVELPRKITKDSCPRCCILYKDTGTRPKVEAPKHPNRFRRRILRNTEGASTSFQKNYLKRLQDRNETNPHTFLSRTCGACKHKTKRVLPKPIPKEEVVEVTPVSVKTKKKKKKDRFSGLNVAALTPQVKFVEKQPQATSRKSVKETPKKIEPPTTPKTLFNLKNKSDKKKKMKGLKDMLTNSKKSGPANSLKNFLDSL